MVLSTIGISMFDHVVTDFFTHIHELIKYQDYTYNNKQISYADIIYILMDMVTFTTHQHFKKLY